MTVYGMIAFGAGLLTAFLGTLMLLTSLTGKVHTVQTDDADTRTEQELTSQVHPITACACGLLLIVIWTLTIFLVPGMRPW